jgi:acyl carrier protein
MSHSSLESTANQTPPMTFDAVELLVRQTIAKRLRLDIENIQLDTHLHDLNLDSLDLAELLFLLEDQIKKQINIDQTANLKTVQDVVTLVIRNQ